MNEQDLLMSAQTLWAIWDLADNREQHSVVDQRAWKSVREGVEELLEILPLPARPEASVTTVHRVGTAALLSCDWCGEPMGDAVAHFNEAGAAFHPDCCPACEQERLSDG